MLGSQLQPDLPTRLGHVQVAVALMNRYIKMGMPREQRAEFFARTLHNSWGVGNPACNDGVLLLLSVEDRQVRVAT